MESEEVALANHPLGGRSQPHHSPWHLVQGLSHLPTGLPLRGKINIIQINASSKYSITSLVLCTKSSINSSSGNAFYYHNTEVKMHKKYSSINIYQYLMCTELSITYTLTVMNMNYFR